MARFSENIFCPLTIGGGVSTVEQARELIARGADKVVIGSAANVKLIRMCAEKLGSQSVMAAVDFPGGSTGESWARALPTTAALAMLLEDAGAGEILLTAINRQGTRSGYDIPLLRVISRIVRIPVIAHGGCGRPEDMAEALHAGAHAVAAGTMFAFSQHTPRSCAEALHREGVKVRLD